MLNANTLEKDMRKVKKTLIVICERLIFLKEMDYEKVFKINEKLNKQIKSLKKGLYQ